jgi:transposase
MSDSTTRAVQDDRLFIGMDVHVRNSYLSVSDAAGRTVKRGRVGNTLGELAEFLGPLEQRPMRVVLESTTNTRAVCGLLRQYAKQSGATLTAEPLNARKVRVIAESVSKCDKLDAAVLSELARSNLKLPACYLPDDEVFALREHLRARADLVRLRTMLKNRLHAVLHRRGVLVPAKMDLFTKLGRQWLKALTLDDEAGRQILDRQLAVIDALDEVIDQSTASLRTLARSQRWCKDEALLRTMPGVGLITALTILAELGDVGRFRSRAAVSNYAGLVPVVRNSDTKHFGGGITRRGPAALRGALAEAAWVSVGRVPQYAVIFDRVATRRGKQVAIVAVARRMLEDAWTMLKTNKVFRLAPAVSTTTTGAQRISDGDADDVDDSSSTTPAVVVVDPSDAG